MKNKKYKNVSFPRNWRPAGFGNLPLSGSLIKEEKQPYLIKQAEDPRVLAGRANSGMTGLFYNGFTLIELLIVVLIIGILAAVAVPQYQKAVDKARVKAMFPIMKNIKQAEEIYRLANGNYTMDFRELNLDLPTKKISSFGTILTTTDDHQYLLSDSGTYPHVTIYMGGVANAWAQIYWALPTEFYLCYPQDHNRGRNLCKSLGCTNVDQPYCRFQP